MYSVILFIIKDFSSSHFTFKILIASELVFSDKLVQFILSLFLSIKSIALACFKISFQLSSSLDFNIYSFLLDLESSDLESSDLESLPNILNFFINSKIFGFFDKFAQFIFLLFGKT